MEEILSFLVIPVVVHVLHVVIVFQHIDHFFHAGGNGGIIGFSPGLGNHGNFFAGDGDAGSFQSSVYL